MDDSPAFGRNRNLRQEKTPLLVNVYPRVNQALFFNVDNSNGVANVIFLASDVRPLFTW